ncbi:hypothetical protein MBLNU230_g1592t1 [Neophaeotheca triangularis]
MGEGRFDLPWEPPSTSPTRQTHGHYHDESSSNYSRGHHHNYSSDRSYNSSAASPSHTATTATTAQSSTAPSPPTDPALVAQKEALEAHQDWRTFGVGDKPPAPQVLAAVANIPVYDSEGRGRMFASLYDPNWGQTREPRQLILFVRHFYCGACQAFIRALARGISPYDFFHLPQRTQIVVVGCGAPNLIAHYRAVTGCPWPIYADPSRLLFKGLGMSLTLRLGGQPQYMHDVSVPDVLKGFLKELKGMRMEERFQGGNMFQIGGEFLFEEGNVRWCHRMKNMRGHAEVEDIKRVLGMEG